MVLAKRILLFLVVNFLVVSAISFLLYIFNVQPYLTHHGLNISSLAIFCLFWGMGGSFISLALSKISAKWMMGLEVIDPNTRDPYKKALLDSVHQLAQKAGLPENPEVAIYQSPEVNAFATGPSRSNSLVAVSTGLLRKMNKEELDGVLAHEVTHIANGDMVTMTLLQGIINAFVMFLARIIAFAISRGSRSEREESYSTRSYLITYLLQMVFMVFGSIVIARFSRFREFRADAGGAMLAGKQNMISALQALKRTFDVEPVDESAKAFQALKISSKGGFLSLFATHPPLDERIARLQRMQR